jgi:metal-responsive CopG/Arc/MetJ family transcriptional regulator
MLNRRVVVLIPENLLEAVDQVADKEFSSRSAFIRAAMQHLLDERKLAEKREKMKEMALGYQKMGLINLELSEEGISNEMEEIDRYLDTLIMGENN